MALAILSFTINKRRKASEIASPTLTEDWTSYGTLIQSPLLPWVSEMVFYFSIMGGCGAVEEAGCWGAGSQPHPSGGSAIQSSVHHCQCVSVAASGCVCFFLYLRVSVGPCVYLCRPSRRAQCDRSWGRCW